MDILVSHFTTTLQICAGLQGKFQATVSAGPGAKGIGREAGPCGYGLVQRTFAPVAPQ